MAVAAMPGRRQGHDHPEQGLQARAAVDARGALQVLGDGLEVAVQDPHRDGQEPAGVADDQGQLGVHQLQDAAEDDVQRDQVHQGRHHLGADQHEQEPQAPLEVEARQRVARDRAQGHAERHGDPRPRSGC